MERIAFDAGRMALNRGGRAYWTKPPEGTRKGSLVAVDPATLPNAAPPPEPPPEPATPVSQTPDAGATRAREEPAEPPPPNPAARVEAGLGGVPLPKFNPPEPKLPELEEAPPDEPAGEPPELGEDAAERVGEPGEVTGPPQPYEPSGAMVRGSADIHEMLTNTFLARFPRKYTPEERADVEEALSGILRRYGGGVSEYDELIGFGFATAGVALARMGPACEACGCARNPEGALFCIDCGAGIGRGGACVNHAGTFNGRPCPVEGLPPGTKFCPGCGTDQRVNPATAPQPTPPPRPGHRTTDPPTSGKPEPTTAPPPATSPSPGPGRRQVEEVG